MSDHPRASIAVIARFDGAAPRVAQALLRRHAPPAIDVVRATDGTPTPGIAHHVRVAMEERGLPSVDLPHVPVPDAAHADVIVNVAEVPRLGDEYRGKRITFWRTSVLSPGSSGEARRLVEELEREASCLVEEYRRRLH